MKINIRKKLKRILALGLGVVLPAFCQYTNCVAREMTREERAIAEQYEFDLGNVTGEYTQTSGSFSKKGLSVLPSNTKSYYIEDNLAVRYSQGEGSAWSQSIYSKFGIKAKVICGVCASAAQLTSVLSKAAGKIIKIDPYDFLCTLNTYGKKYGNKGASSYYSSGFAGYDRLWGECVSDSWNVTVMFAGCNYEKYSVIKDLIKFSNSTVQYSIGDHVIAALGVTKDNKILIADTKRYKDDLVYGVDSYSDQKVRLIVISTDYKVVNGKLYEGNNLVTRYIGPFTEIVSNGCVYSCKKKDDYYACTFVRFTHESNIPEANRTVNNTEDMPLSTKELFRHLGEIQGTLPGENLDSFTLAGAYLNSNCIDIDAEVALNSGVEITGDPTCTVITNSTGLALRKDPDLDAEELDVIPKGASVRMLEDPQNNDEWTRVVTENGKEGYVHTEYIESVESPALPEISRAVAEEIQVATVESGDATLTLREGQDFSATPISQIPNGETIMIVEDPKNNEEWTHVVTTNGQEGYVCNDYISEPQQTSIIGIVKESIDSRPEEQLIDDEIISDKVVEVEPTEVPTIEPMVDDEPIETIEEVETTEGYIYEYSEDSELPAMDFTEVEETKDISAGYDYIDQCEEEKKVIVAFVNPDYFRYREKGNGKSSKTR